MTSHAVDDQESLAPTPGVPPSGYGGAEVQDDDDIITLAVRTITGELVGEVAGRPGELLSVAKARLEQAAPASASDGHRMRVALAVPDDTATFRDAAAAGGEVTVTRFMQTPATDDDVYRLNDRSSTDDLFNLIMSRYGWAAAFSSAAHETLVDRPCFTRHPEAAHLLEAMLSGPPEDLQELLDARKDKRGANGGHTLHQFVRGLYSAQKPDLITVLLDARADPKAVDAHNETALDDAIRCLKEAEARWDAASSHNELAGRRAVVELLRNASQ